MNFHDRTVTEHCSSWFSPLQTPALDVTTQATRLTLKATREPEHDEKTPLVCSGVYKIVYELPVHALPIPMDELTLAATRNQISVNLFLLSGEECWEAPGTVKKKTKEYKTFDFQSITVDRHHGHGTALIILNRAQIKLCSDTASSARFFFIFKTTADPLGREIEICSTRDHLFWTVSRKNSCKPSKRKSTASDHDHHSKRTRLSPLTTAEPPPPSPQLLCAASPLLQLPFGSAVAASLDFSPPLFDWPNGEETDTTKFLNY